MNLLEIIILGIVEVLTEYLPVSSTGHLLLTESLLNMSQSKEALDALAVCIQGGAILAVLSLYFPRVKAMAQGVRGNNPAGLKLLVNLILAFLPAAVVGLCCASLIKEYLFNTYTVAYSWIVGGGVILAYCAWRAREGRSNEGDSGASIESLTPAKALTVGALQCVAMIPGTSRSLMTMLGGMFVECALCGRRYNAGRGGNGAGIAEQIIRFHCLDDQAGLDAIDSQPYLSRKEKERSKHLYRICKDMDGLDRIRFNGLDYRLLRTEYGRKLPLVAGCLLNEDLLKALQTGLDGK